MPDPKSGWLHANSPLFIALPPPPSPRCSAPARRTCNDKQSDVRLILNAIVMCTKEPFVFDVAPPPCLFMHLRAERVRQAV